MWGTPGFVRVAVKIFTLRNRMNAGMNSNKMPNLVPINARSRKQRGGEGEEPGFFESLPLVGGLFGSKKEGAAASTLGPEGPIVMPNGPAPPATPHGTPPATPPANPPAILSGGRRNTRKNRKGCRKNSRKNRKDRKDRKNRKGSRKNNRKN